jgi:hypothetical protein
MVADATKRTENAQKRVIGRPFKPGNPGGGRPKIRKDLQALCQQSTAQNVERLRYLAENGDPSESIAAIKLLWAYGYGMPTQAVQHSGTEGQPLKLYVEFSPADWEASSS